ncbi:hypothetical protein MD484_g1016, partial [Candolleomyces efflorescens]
MNPCASILSQLMSNNSPPEPLDAGSLRAEADRLRRVISAQREKLRKNEELLRKHETVLSVTRKVPADVWGIIISFVLPACNTKQDWQELSRLNLVCKDWYQAAHYAHRFSSRVRVAGADLDYDKVLSWSRRATEGTFLEIGRKLPCPLHSDQSGRKDTFKCTFDRPALLRLMAEGPVLDHLCFDNVEAGCYKHLLDLLASKGTGISSRLWNNLKKLTLRLRLERAITAVEPELIDLPPCITYLDLALSEPVTWIDIGVSPLPISPSAFKLLTTFSLQWDWDHYDGKVLLDALSHCANLDTLALNFESGKWSCKGSPEPQAVTLPSLHSLKLTKPNNGSIEVLKFIHTPALVRLNLHIASEIPSSTLSSFVKEQFTTSQGALHVTLRASYVGRNWNVLTLLQQVPHINHLILDGCVTPIPNHIRRTRGDPEFFDSLGDEKNVLVHLKTLEILNLVPEISVWQVANYISARKRQYPDDGLETVIVKYRSANLPMSCTVHSLYEIERMRKAGLSVLVEHPKLSHKDLLDVMYK